MTVLERQHAAEVLSLTDFAYGCVGGCLFLAVVVLARVIARDRRAADERDRQREEERAERLRAARAEHLDWTGFQWPSVDRRETTLTVLPPAFFNDEERAA